MDGTERTSMVHDVEILEGGVTHTASYFVEHGVIHANVVGRIFICSVNGGDPGTMVTSLLRGRLQHNARKTQNADLWREAGGEAGATAINWNKAPAG